MFIPLFIAILLGLANPSTSNTCSNNNNTVVSTQGTPGDDGSGGGGEEDPGKDTGGEIGNNPPR